MVSICVVQGVGCVHMMCKFGAVGFAVLVLGRISYMQSYVRIWVDQT
jgi:hypothetical protein